MSDPTGRWVAAAGSPGGGGDVVLDVAPQHPGAHGLLRLALRTDGDRVIAAEPLVGFMHRGAEKLFEVRDYRQILMLANRHDWLSAFGNELGVVLAVERLLGLSVPERATWLRTCLAELNRALSHLMFLGTDPTRAVVPDGPVRPAFRARERLQLLLEEATGGRVHFMFNRVGGVKEDLPAGWLERALSVVADVRADLVQVGEVFAAEPFAARARDLGRLPAHAVDAYGVSGPLARASGVDVDLRRDEPYLAYGELDVGSVVRTDGDCLARYECLLEQTDAALTLAERCVHRLGELTGPVNVRLPKTVRAPEGETYAWTENPLGINGYYLVSRGGPTPWRLKLRTASFNNVQALRVVLPGTHVDDVALVLASMFYVVGDIDK